jgi:hypothetical protein
MAVDFETLLPRLVATYEAGRLVPFIGSGMSRRTCTDWPTFVGTLETATGESGLSPLDSTTPRDVLIRRANRAVRTLKRREPGAFAQAIRASLISKEPGTEAVPPQTRALARIWWPLLLSTNYDNCFAAAYRDGFPNRHLAVVGRSAEDCQRVLNSLSTAGRSLFWALQGYLHDVPYAGLGAEVTPAPELVAALETQVVVGHEEYRRVTYRDLHFRRAFAEVFRQRSLLFLGAGLQENYLQELFGEVLEFYGPGARPHYAFIQQGEVDPDFMLSRFQIVVVEYPKGQHGAIQQWLERLGEEVSRPRRTAVAWSWGRIDRRDEDDWTSVADLEVVRGPLPIAPVEGECLAVSAGGSGDDFFFSSGIRRVMKGWGVMESMPARLTSYLGAFAQRPVYAVRARSEKDERSLAHVYDASLALFQHVAERYRGIRMQLLATGGTDKAGVTNAEWRVRNYPERFSFVQTVRAWAAWRKTHPAVECKLTLHVVLDSVYHDIASGRIDVLELLSCADIRFFVEVVSDAGEIERRLFQTMPDLTLAEVVEDLQLSTAQWTVKVTPPPSLDDRWIDLTPETLTQTLQTLGVVPGSTVHFHRPEPR